MISVSFQGKPFNIRVIQVYAPTSKAKEAEVEWFYEDLQELLDSQVGFSKGRGTRDQIANIRWIMERVPEKHLFLLY